MPKNDTNDLSTNQSTSDFLLEPLHSFGDISADDWNSLVPSNYPFLRHEFLSALESTGCASPQTGWVPAHILLRNPTSGGLLAAAPAYLKFHSFGEYIFDWNWDAYFNQFDVEYYPKLVLQTPFTPLLGPKILVAPDSESKDVRHALFSAGKQIAESEKLSSIHWLFITEEELNGLKGDGYSIRGGAFQFVWRNEDYTNMDDFLSALSSRKRKKIRRERRAVAEQGITVEVIEGENLKDLHWHAFAHFYSITIYRHYARKYLSLEFFKEIGRTMPENIVMFLASKDGEYVGASFCLRSSDSLFGRYWGCNGDYPFLHFETCYYSAIEYCISKGISMYDGGTRGDHKLDRGFLAEIRYAGLYVPNPMIRHDLHYLARQETQHYSDRIDELNANSAYRCEST